MKRAFLLIITLAVFSVGFGLWMDLTQRGVARDYLQETEQMRRQLLYGDMEVLREGQRHLNARWQKDSRWLNCLIDHHHTRAVSSALLQLSTALEHGWKEEALKALDLLQDALNEISGSDFLRLDNVL